MKLRSSVLALVAASAALVIAASAAVAKDRGGKHKHHHFVGIHPIPKAHGGGLCHIEASHVHVFPIDVEVQYRSHAGASYFVGDPVAYGWDGDRETYYGPHPIDISVVVGDPDHDEAYCYLGGPHFHAFAPAPTYTADFKVEGGAYFFVGTPPPTYVEARPALVKINAIYEPIVYARPVITVTPPSAWIGIRFAAPVVVAPVAAHGEVVAPSVRAQVVVPAIEIRPPSIEVGIGVGISGGIHVGGGGTVNTRGKGKGKGKVKWK